MTGTDQVSSAEVLTLKRRVLGHRVAETSKTSGWGTEVTVCRDGVGRRGEKQ